MNTLTISERQKMYLKFFKKYVIKTRILTPQQIEHLFIKNLVIRIKILQFLLYWKYFSFHLELSKIIPEIFYVSMVITINVAF
jgi:hypothetical protein